jgi:hypothetical protein
MYSQTSNKAFLSFLFKVQLSYEGASGKQGTRNFSEE